MVGGHPGQCQRFGTRAVECASVAGAWLNGRAPDSGSGGSRFESWRASQLLPGVWCVPSLRDSSPSVAGAAPLPSETVRHDVGTEPAEAPERRDFIRDIVAADIATAASRSRSPASRPSPTATCTSATRSRSASTSGSPREFGGRCNLRFDDTNPAKEEQEYLDAIEARRALAGLRLGRPPLPRVGLLRAAVRLGRPPHRARPRLRRRPVGRRDPRDARHAHRHRARDRPGATARWTRTSTCSRACARASSRTGRECCARRSTWPRPTSTCATRSCTGSSTPPIPGPATPGASTRPTTSRTASPTRSRA